MNQIKAASNSAPYLTAPTPTTFNPSSVFVSHRHQPPSLRLLPSSCSSVSSKRYPFNELTCNPHPPALHPAILVDGQHCKILLIVFNSTCCPERISSNHIALSNGLVRSNRCCFFLPSQLTNLYCRFRTIFSYVP
jgi:hypothetical protein